MATWNRIEVGLVLQGGGALGAYEWGAIDALFALMDEVPNSTPVSLRAVTGVSIGAINGACIVGATSRQDGLDRLEALWKDLQLETPFSRDLSLGWPGLSSFAPARDLALFGLPGFYRPRIDVWNFQHWTNLYDTSPLAETLQKHVKFDAIKTSDTSFVVTAVDVMTGTLKRFRNHPAKSADPDVDQVVDFAPAHVLASGSLAPQFPWTEVGGKQYWDGGIVDNTPLGDALDAFSDDDGVYRLLVVMNLFPLATEKLPENLLGVTERVQELSYGNRLRQDQATAKRVNQFVRTIEQLYAAAKEANATLDPEIEQQVQKVKQFKIAKTVEIELRGGGIGEDSNAARDFSPETVARRRDIGRSRAMQSLRPVLVAENFLAAQSQPVLEPMES